MPVEETENSSGSSTQGIPGRCKEQETYDEKLRLDPQAAGGFRRDLGYLEGIYGEGYALLASMPTSSDDCGTVPSAEVCLTTIHTALKAGLSVSASHTLRPIVRGKAKNPTEFGAKYDVSIDEKGYCPAGKDPV